MGKLSGNKYLRGSLEGRSSVAQKSGLKFRRKSSAAAGRPRRRHGYTSTCPYGHVLVLPSRRLLLPAADDEFVICRSALMDIDVKFRRTFHQYGR